MPTVLLVRHGRSTSNTAGTLAGWTPGVELDEQGREGADALGRRLAGLPLRRVVTSPLTRCRQTTEAVLAQVADAPEPIVDDELGECHYGSWTGRSLAELAKEPLWRTVQDQPTAARFPDSDDFRAESLAEMSARAVAAIRRHDAQVAAEHGPGAIWLAVSHGDVIKAILADAAGVHLDLFQRFMVSPASLSVVRYTEGRPFVERVNDLGGSVEALRPAGPSDGSPGHPVDGTKDSPDAPAPGTSSPSANPSANPSATPQGSAAPGDAVVGGGL